MRRLPPSREFYIPKGSAKIAPKCGGVVFYIYEMAGMAYAMCFIGKAQKPAWHYRYKSADLRAKRMADQIASVQASAEMKAKRKADMNKPHAWEKGLILVSSWGYEQTNVDFFEVVGVIGSAYVEIQEIGSVQATDDQGGGSSMSNYVVPDPEIRVGEVQRVKVQFGARVRVSSCATASVWDGKKRYCSWYA